MKLNLLKGFAAIAMVCMVGAVFATPVALGDIGAAYYGANAAVNGDDTRSFIINTAVYSVSAGVAVTCALAFTGPAGVVAGVGIVAVFA
jgi:hypothetical protein